MVSIIYWLHGGFLKWDATPSHHPSHSIIKIVKRKNEKIILISNFSFNTLNIT